MSHLREDERLLHLFLHSVFVNCRVKSPNIGNHLFFLCTFVLASLLFPFLFLRRTGKEFHNEQLRLYAKYDPGYLIHFLEGSTHYQLEDALKICHDYKLHRETVFIMERMGKSDEALALIITQLRDIKYAVEFVAKQSDDELWEVLISAAMEREEYIGALLENIGGHVDPIILLDRIPKGKKIPRLRDHLVKIISDYNLEMSLRKGCNEILKTDSVELAEKYVKGQRKGVRIDRSAHCAICQESVGSSEKGSGGFVVFFCRHVFHNRCIAPASSASASGTPSSSSSSASDLRLSGQRGGKLHCTLCEKNQELSSRISRREIAK